MWDMNTLPVSGNFSLRKIALSLLAVIISAFLWAIVGHSTVYAADATWSGENLSYNNTVYTPDTGTFAGVPSGSTVYVNKAQDGTLLSAIYYPSNTDTTKEFSVTRIEFQNNTPGPPSSITVDAKPIKEKTQCDVPGVGWIICASSRWIAEGMDNIFDWVASFLEVKPVTTDTSSGLYQSWKIMLGIANLMFVIAFLVIIYSQITSYGLNNYNIKKMVPKLIVAAILVNVSYYICSIAVDLSNIIGYSLQEALVNIRNSIPGPTPGSADWLSWTNVTEYILSGGTIVAAGIAGWSALIGGTTGGVVSNLVFLLFPILIAGALAVLIALLVLAARQALITVLIVVSPLAFVAYLLPNTEKWFEKWKDLFTTMLLVFPLFSLLFGGSQLASSIIIQNAEQASVVILAMFVQVAPLVMTPFLVKFSGSLLGRLAGMVNDPKRGIVDKSRNWAKDRAEVKRNAGYSAAANGRGTWLQNRAWNKEKGRRNREGLKGMYEAEADAAWHNDDRYHAIHKRNKVAGLIKASGESGGDVQFEHAKANSPTLQAYSGRQRLNQDSIKAYQQEEERAFAESKTVAATTLPNTHRFKSIADDAQIAQRRIDVAESALAGARAVQREDFGSALVADEALQAEAGGVAGAERALAVGVSEYRKAYGDRVNEANAILKHFNLSGPQRQDHAMGLTVEATDQNGNMKIFRKDSQYTREAAIEAQLATGTYDEVTQIIEASATDLAGFRTTIQEGVASNKLSQKAVFYGGQTINDIGQGNVVGPEGVNAAILRTFVQGKISAGDLAMNDVNALKRMWDVIDRASTDVANGATPPNGVSNAEFNERLSNLREAAASALNNRSISGSVKDNSRTILEQMRGPLPPTPPTGS
ncbi:hypothetical protein A2707_03185 [Candidatus Saccharibacteria bacterium RIFCSPHIGHO2_01_FULL_45_15]|nr:MAG: hypothetical protein A2707_03185 [Candidatus Saccharibacteria bacterium RIFCSPHIGHO2_01_FULL_45_15]OGL28458.1 MAG: hypothetical protein A3C39_02875 [Candidatus Saccharibacteria bacterium RIFCSPHIGHO2_02_FULL_46_12]OGL32495.1 MAG: hypothetical protein A3E76_00385 [Candidatus Saccharibacteria bacterium RIFCSPHIGHO2_12_FULL_44_22]